MKQEKRKKKRTKKRNKKKETRNKKQETRKRKNPTDFVNKCGRNAPPPPVGPPPPRPPPPPRRSSSGKWRTSLAYRHGRSSRRNSSGAALLLLPTAPTAPTAPSGGNVADPGPLNNSKRRRPPVSLRPRSSNNLGPRRILRPGTAISHPPSSLNSTWSLHFQSCQPHQQLSRSNQQNNQHLELVFLNQALVSHFSFTLFVIYYYGLIRIRMQPPRFHVRMAAARMAAARMAPVPLPSSNTSIHPSIHQISINPSN